MSKSVDLSIIIVSYNTSHLTCESVKSVVSTIKNANYEIIVVDNASADDSVEQLKRLKVDTLNIIENKENTGFSKANNIGIKNSKGRYVLFLNSDTVVYENTLDEMVKFMDEHPTCGASTCYLEMPNGKMDDASHRGFPTPWRSLSHFSGLSKLFPTSKLFGGYQLGWMDLSKTHKIEALVGAFMLVRRVAGEEVGWWDEDFFWYGEDLDFCYRLYKKKWEIYFVPEYKILHYKGASGGLKSSSQKVTTATNETKIRSTNARFDAMKIFYDKHYKNKYPSILNWMVLQGVELKRKLALQKISK